MMGSKAGDTTIAIETGPGQLTARLAALRDNEPDPIDATTEAVEAYIRGVRDLIADASQPGAEQLNETQWRYLHEAARHQVRFAQAQLETNRHAAQEKLNHLFRMGTPPEPDGRYEGDLIGISTGLLSDPFFQWLTRIYLPWKGKTFDLETHSGDNVFIDNVWSKATEKMGWPEYRMPNDEPPGTVRVFPFKTYVGEGIEDRDRAVLKIDYSDPRNPLPVRRVVDEVVELPGGYILGKAHMRGLREFRRVAFFGLSKA